MCSLGVSPKVFELIEKERAVRRRNFRLRRYNATRKLLTIMIPSKAHDRLHGELYSRVYRQLCFRGLDNNWRVVHGTTYKDRQSGDGGEGDTVGQPLPARQSRDSWPTLVIEAGWSASLARLRDDMAWWFGASNHEVKTVVLAKFDNGQQKLILEKYEEEPAIYRAGTPVLKQEIIITRNTATDPASYHVTGDALVLSYRKLFLRDPGPIEGDMTISVEDLRRYADLVWVEDED